MDKTNIIKKDLTGMGLNDNMLSCEANIRYIVKARRETVKNFLTSSLKLIYLNKFLLGFFIWGEAMIKRIEDGNSKARHTLNFLTNEMRMYILIVLTKFRKQEIKCSMCGSYTNLEFHHVKYENVTVNDIKLVCEKCHRNDDHKRSQLSTVFENGKRFCVGYNFKFEY